MPVPFQMITATKEGTVAGSITNTQLVSPSPPLYQFASLSPPLDQAAYPLLPCVSLPFLLHTSLPCPLDLCHLPRSAHGERGNSMEGISHCRLLAAGGGSQQSRGLLWTVIHIAPCLPGPSTSPNRRSNFLTIVCIVSPPCTLRILTMEEILSPCIHNPTMHCR